MVMPNFFIIGAAKSGTTSLYYRLKQHAQIYMTPTKETNFFAFEGESLNFTGVKVNESTKSYQKEIITDIYSYRQQFNNINQEVAIGESCPSYLYIPKAAKNIKHYTPQAKIIVILRDPIDRAYSNFLHNIRERSEYYDDFLQAIDAESWRIANGWWWGFHYVQTSLYYEQLKRYFEIFDRSQIKIILFSQLKNNYKSLVSDLYQFLEVDDVISIETPSNSKKYNSTGIPTNRLLDNLIKDTSPVKTIYQLLIPSKTIRKKITTKVNNLNPLIKPDMTLEMREKLLPLFQKDILKVQNLIQQDLSAWLK